MKKLSKIIFLISICTTFAQNSELVLYRWLGENSVIGKGYTLGRIKEVSLNVPQNYIQSHWHYGEGVITTLQYSDSMYVSLHIGLSVSKPFLNFCEKVDSISNEVKIVRSGNSNGLYWKEVNFKELPISIFYENVPALYKDIFDKIIDSFLINKS